MKVTNLYCMNTSTVFKNLVLNTLLELCFLNLLIPISSFRNQRIGCYLTLSWSSLSDGLYVTINHRHVFCILFDFSQDQ